MPHMQQQQQQQQQQEEQREESGSEDLTMTWINQNHLIESMQYSAESEQLSMDNLLELELSAEESSPIDKFIDLDEIEVNPLEYRCGAHMVCSQMDEFNVQFSVCSSGSSGFSEPSNFSCSSSISGASGSNLGYGNCGTNVLSVNSVNNLFSPDDSSPCAYQSYEHNSPYPNAYTIGGAQHLTLDWNMMDLAADKPSESAVNCGDNTIFFVVAVVAAVAADAADSVVWIMANKNFVFVSNVCLPQQQQRQQQKKETHFIF
ncbi:hypothetical protein BpHYR1_018074 [Brachionus plicatilis]|uniref:Uncharacterized protein n=1 Tax=Brachionus plicatilis TaxID=10195 RepID=A0A3M7R7S0_BRAPC|nr:hypothetical protein BpHYR1_018074 [Brachionus plicatilis]